MWVTKSSILRLELPASDELGLLWGLRIRPFRRTFHEDWSQRKGFVSSLVLPLAPFFNVAVCAVLVSSLVVVLFLSSSDFYKTPWRGSEWGAIECNPSVSAFRATCTCRAICWTRG